MGLLPMPLFWCYAVLAHLFCKLCRLKIGYEWSYTSPPSLRLHALCVEWLGSHMTDIHILYGGGTLLKSVKKFQVWLKSNKNIWHGTWRPEYIYNYFSLNSPWDEKVSNERCGENHNTLFMSKTFFQKAVLLTSYYQKYNTARKSIDI